MVEKECEYCKQNIDYEKEKYVLLGTYTAGYSLQENFYHFECFKEWHTKSVSNKAKKGVKKMQETAQGLFSNIVTNPIFSSIVGQNPQFREMINTEINIEDLPNIDEVLKGKKDKNESNKQRRKRKSRKKSSKQ